MKKRFFTIVCVLIAALFNANADVTLRFWDNGVLIRDTVVAENLNTQTLTSYYNKESLMAASHLSACDGYTFVGWKEATPLINETTDDDEVEIASTIDIHTEDIDLFAVYAKYTTCYQRISSTDDLKAGTNYLIVGQNGSNYFAMRGDNGANVKENASDHKMAGLDSDGVTVCDNGKIYSPATRCIWKLGGSNNNWTWQNQGTNANYIRLEASIGLSGIRYLNNMLASSQTMTIGIANEVVTMAREQTYNVVYTANIAISFAPSVAANNNYFGEAKSNIFLASVPSSGTEALSGSSITKGNIYLYKQVSETRYKCKCGPYTLVYKLCGDNSCGEDFTLAETSFTETSNLAGCTGLVQFSGIDTTGAIPSISCPARWEFAGWATTPCADKTFDTPTYTPENPYQLRHLSDTLYAVYRRLIHGVESYWSSYPDCIRYDVIFDPVYGSVNGENVPYTITETTAGVGVTTPAATFATCSGWTFAGWSETPCPGVTSEPDVLAAGSTYCPAVNGETLYAVYTKGGLWTSYPLCAPADLTLDAGAGTINGNPTATITEVGTNSGVTLTPDAVFGVSCAAVWTFVGWAESQITGHSTIAPTLHASNSVYYPKTLSEDILYAVYRRGSSSRDYIWTSLPNCEAYHVVLHSSGIEETLTESSLAAGITFPAAAPACERWSFAGWHKGSPIEHKYTLPDGLVAEDSVYIPLQDNEAFYAVYKHVTMNYWTSNPDCTVYTLTLHACEGELSPGVANVDSTEASAGNGILLPAPTSLCDSRGWSFLGWVEGGDLATTQDITGLPVYPAETRYKPIRNNMHLYAVYSVNGYKQVTSYDELNTTDEYVIVFYWNYGNDYAYENFALSCKAHAFPYNLHLSLTPIEAYLDAEGNKYVASPSDSCKWKLSGNQTSGWQFYNERGRMYVNSQLTTSPIYKTNLSADAARFTINLEEHCIERYLNNSNYRYWHFLNVGVGSSPNPTFYALQGANPDRCDLYHITGTVYSSWPHCKEYTVYFDGCDGTADEEYLTETDAGKGITVPTVSQICEGWAFAGWATAHVNGKTNDLTQHLYLAGTTFVPDRNNMTLYAVYAVLKDTFELISTKSDIYLGRNYLVVNSDNNRAMGNTEQVSVLLEKRITSVSVSPVGNQILSDNTAIRWRLQGEEDYYQFYNPAAAKYLDFIDNNDDASLLDITNDNFKFIEQGSNRFYVKTNSSNASHPYLVYGSSGEYFNSYGSAQNLYIYRQKADYWSYPCSEMIEPLAWGDGTVTVESLTLDGEPTGASVVIDGVASGENGTYVISHNGRPGRKMRILWDGNYYRMTVPYVATPTYIPAVENLPSSDLVLLPETRFTVDLNTHLHTVSVYEDASLVIAEGDTLFVDTLYLRSNGSEHHPSITFGGTTAAIVVNSGVLYYDLRIDDQAYYPMSLPYSSSTNQVHYAGLVSDEAIPVPAKGSQFWIKYYDGPQRTADVNSGIDVQYRTYWRHITGHDLTGGIGYSIGIADNEVGNHSKRTLRFRMALRDGWNNYENGTRDTVITITPSKVNAIDKRNHSGWNFIGNPYLHTYYPGAADETSGLLSGHFVMDATGKWIHNDIETVPYFTFYDAASEDYYQTHTDMAGMKPFSTAFIQVEENDMLLFKNPMETRLNVAGLSRKTAFKSPIIRTGLLLYTSDNSGNFCYDEAGLVISNRYSTDYEVGADLVKWSNPQKLHVYTRIANQSLAFNALDEQSAAQPIPVDVSIPHNGSYTFCFDSRQYDRELMDALWLTDTKTGEMTNLLENEYTCFINAGVNESRFLLNAIVRKNGTPTDNESVTGSGVQVLTHEDGTMTVISSDKIVGMTVYDIAGRLVGEWTPDAFQWTMNLPQGVYAVGIKSDNNIIKYIKVCSK